MSIFSIQVVYRGVFQETLGRRICSGIIMAVRGLGKVGIAFGRYGDSPERNGIPTKGFAVVADDESELQTSLAIYEPSAVDICIVLDDTLCKGIESWAWHGVEPVNARLKKNGTLLVVSTRLEDELLQHIHKKDTDYELAVVKGVTSFSGLWVYRNDGTDAVVLGALAKVCTQLVTLSSIENMIQQQWKDEKLVDAAHEAYQEVRIRRVSTREGSSEPIHRIKLPGWREMEEAVVVRPASWKKEPGRDTAFKLPRNPHFSKATTRSMRPVIDFDKCTRCGYCWLQCPDSCIDVTADGLYDVDLEICCGCNLCEAVCPVNCIAICDEAEFVDSGSQYQAWKKDRKAYREWLQDKVQRQTRLNRPVGFSGRGSYG